MVSPAHHSTRPSLTKSVPLPDSALNSPRAFSPAKSSSPQHVFPIPSDAVDRRTYRVSATFRSAAAPVVVSSSSFRSITIPTPRPITPPPPHLSVSPTETAFTSDVKASGEIQVTVHIAQADNAYATSTREARESPSSPPASLASPPTSLSTSAPSSSALDVGLSSISRDHFSTRDFHQHGYFPSNHISETDRAAAVHHQVTSIAGGNPPTTTSSTQNPTMPASRPSSEPLPTRQSPLAPAIIGSILAAAVVFVIALTSIFILLRHRRLKAQRKAAAKQQRTPRLRPLPHGLSRLSFNTKEILARVSGEKSEESDLVTQPDSIAGPPPPPPPPTRPQPALTFPDPSAPNFSRPNPASTSSTPSTNSLRGRDRDSQMYSRNPLESAHYVSHFFRPRAQDQSWTTYSGPGPDPPSTDEDILPSRTPSPNRPLPSRHSATLALLERPRTSDTNTDFSSVFPAPPLQAKPPAPHSSTSRDSRTWAALFGGGAGPNPDVEDPSAPRHPSAWRRSHSSAGRSRGRDSGGAASSRRPSFVPLTPISSVGGASSEGGRPRGSGRSSDPFDLVG